VESGGSGGFKLAGSWRAKEVEARMTTMTVRAMPYTQSLTRPSSSKSNLVRLSTHTNDCSAEASLVSLP
jgi:hypothetical protein